MAKQRKKTEAEIDEVLWRELKPLLPAAKPRRFRHPGRRPHEPRAALGGILFVLRTGIGWARLPWALGFGSGMSCWRRLREGQQAGVWAKLNAVLLARLRAAEQIDWSRAVADSSSVRALKGGQTRGQVRRTGAGRAANTTSSLTAAASRSPRSSRRPSATT